MLDTQIHNRNTSLDRHQLMHAIFSLNALNIENTIDKTTENTMQSSSIQEIA